MHSSDSLRLLIVTPYFDTHIGHLGGIQVGTGTMNRKLAAAGFQVTWMASGQAPRSDENGLGIVALGAHHGIERLTGAPFPMLTLRGLVQLVGAVRRTQIAIVRNHNNPVSLCAAIALRLFRKPFLMVVHSGYGYEGRWWLRTAAFIVNHVMTLGMKLADRLIFVSESQRLQWSARSIRRPPIVVPNGVDKTCFAPASPQDRRTARQKLHLSSDARVILFVGRFTAGKGIGLIGRLARLRPDFVWLLVGDGRLDPTSWKLPNVRVFGRMPHCEMAQFYHAADALILPSRREGHPLVVLEALACGLPVVTSVEVALIFGRRDVVGAPIGEDADASARLLSAALDMIPPEPPPPLEGVASWDDICGEYLLLLREIWLDRLDRQGRRRRGALEQRRDECEPARALSRHSRVSENPAPSPRLDPRFRGDDGGPA